MGGVANDERAAVEVLAVGIECRFGGLEIGCGQLVAQRRERIITVVIDEKDTACSRHTTRRFDVAGDALHRNVEHFDICRPQCTNREAFGEGPTGVVVWILLRIVRAPVLIVEERVGDARVRLVHADDVASRWKRPCLRRCRGRRRRAVAGGAGTSSAAAASTGSAPNGDRHRERLRRA